MNDIEVSSIDLVEGGNVFKQGHYLTLGYVPRDENGETVDLSGKTLNVALWGRKGVVFEASATFSGGVIRFTLDKTVPAAEDYTVEFTATSSTDAKYRKKFPANSNAARIAIKQSADDLGVIGISVYTVAQFQKVFDEAVGAVTEDSEVILARDGESLLGTRLDKDKQELALQLADKAQQSDLEIVKAQADNLIANAGDTDGNAELLDLRVTFDGKTYPTAGEATRATGVHIGEINEELEQHKGIVYDHLYRAGNVFSEKTGNWEETNYKNIPVGTLKKNTDHMNIQATYTGATIDLGISTGKAINLTNVKRVYIDWEQTETNAGARATFLVSRYKTGTAGSVIEGVSTFSVNRLNRGISELDVSGLTGDYFIRFHASSSNSTGVINMNVYGIYTDDEIAKRAQVASATSDLLGKFNVFSYPYTPTAVGGFTSPVILEKQTGSTVHFRLRADNHNIEVRPTQSKVDKSFTWSQIKTTLSANLITVNSVDFISIPEGNALVVDTLSGNLLIVTRALIAPYHVVLMLNSLGVVVAGEATKWFYSPHKFGENSLPAKIVKTENLSDSLAAAIANTGAGTSERKAELDEVIFDSTSKATGADAFRFLFITDTHGEGTAMTKSKEYLGFVNEVEKSGKLDLVVHGGDLVNGYQQDKNIVLKNLLELTKPLHTKTPSFILSGNHDDNSYYDTSNVLPAFVITKKEWRNFALKQVETHVIFDPAEPLSKYSYKDFSHKKVRAIFLDSTDYPDIKKADGSLKWAGFNGWGFGQRQINWLNEIALKDIPVGWSVVVFSHASPSAPVSDFLVPYNSEMICGILGAFKNGATYTESVGITGDWNAKVASDFSAQGARDLIGLFSGHLHRDVIEKEAVNDFTLSITKHSQSNTLGAFDVVTVNPSEKGVHLTRFGDGLDRSYIY